MRIIAGRFRRRKVEARPGLVTRPITDRVKESLFEHLGEVVTGARVADVFAGTGTLGLEALSRGAAGVVFIEHDRRACELLAKNIHSLKLDEEVLCWRVDVLRTSFKPRGVPQLVPFDLIFFDPPYRMLEDLHAGAPLYRSLERLARDEVSSAEAQLLLRSPNRAEFDMPPGWSRTRVLDFGTMEIHWYVRGEPPLGRLDDRSLPQ
ncbi:MAG: 16S rRNA (guanine(966)-N(2))-methyltransferase RsmD [Planctomycetes bacterium]|nr:16S rRNA (guanine(966)-N(2))-methyltransferase RsmD [Planctomycetota bacterium]